MAKEDASKNQRAANRHPPSYAFAETATGLMGPPSAEDALADLRAVYQHWRSAGSSDYYRQAGEMTLAIHNLLNTVGTD